MKKKFIINKRIAMRPRFLNLYLYFRGIGAYLTIIFLLIISLCNIERPFNISSNTQQIYICKYQLVLIFL